MAALISVGRFFTAALLILLLTALTLLVIYPIVRSVFDNPLYADTYFSQLLPEYDVLASRRWHPLFAQPWDCSYAVVSLTEAAPEDPPARTRDVRGWEFAFGPEWQPTPAPELGDNTRDALGFCRRYWESDMADLLQDALSNTGSWYYRDPVGETLDIYSPAYGIAAHIRFGD